ncbi:hypothetical protein MSMTP_2079 [Methanosarcina sp. MTP4]|uniref:hypothetical protein n=1 Tax=Methanosarcina sp. MTP4 TaxID=1434100 RepID=UPI000615C14B|nr:hypothetical protein [Methanosarcina sp. MTP4]AKB25548.1 hypothetical protein MSMTP_2079 [Methanosarcina sp. MTP4]
MAVLKSIRIDSELYAELQETAGEYGYNTVTAATRAAVRQFIDSRKNGEGESESMGWKEAEYIESLKEESRILKESLEKERQNYDEQVRIHREYMAQVSPLLKEKTKSKKSEKGKKSGKSEKSKKNEKNKNV